MSSRDWSSKRQHVSHLSGSASCPALYLVCSTNLPLHRGCAECVRAFLPRTLKQLRCRMMSALLARLTFNLNSRPQVQPLFPNKENRVCRFFHSSILISLSSPCLYLSPADTAQHRVPPHYCPKALCGSLVLALY